MNLLYYGAATLAFIAVALLCEVLWQWWFSTQSKAARRFSSRVRDLVADDGRKRGGSLLKQRRLAESDEWERVLRLLPHSQALDIRLQQAGSQWNLGRQMSLSLWCFLGGALGGQLISHDWMIALALGVLSALLPFAYVGRQRARRLKRFESQLPEAADLISRSLRAGHALPSTLQMVAEELPDPVAGEFRIVSDEVTFGLGLQQAMQRLAERVPLDDLRFLVIAILIQRETGGNLAELTENMARLMRERQKLLGQVRALSAEGRLSGTLLFLLPIVMGVALSVVNPGYVGKLADDPLGGTLLGIAALMQIAGGWWMYRLVDLRV